jgi:hypothetical protein
MKARNLMTVQTSNDRDIFVGSQQIRLYAKDFVQTMVGRDVGAGSARILVDVIGYLVNTP